MVTQKNQASKKFGEMQEFSQYMKEQIKYKDLLYQADCLDRKREV